MQEGLNTTPALADWHFYRYDATALKQSSVLADLLTLNLNPTLTCVLVYRQTWSHSKQRSGWLYPWNSLKTQLNQAKSSR